MMSLVASLASSMSINLLGGGLIVLGGVLLFVTLSFWKSAIEDPEVLAPLEVMADRKYARADETRRLAMLNMVRPDGAEPVVHHAAPSILVREPASEPERPYRDPFNHADDAVEVVETPGGVIDPLLNNNQENY
jgi:hypothetical protein